MNNLERINKSASIILMIVNEVIFNNISLRKSLRLIRCVLLN